MTRWRILTTPWFSIKLHHFHRSDEDRELHDHPWLFVSLILWGGYTEVRPDFCIRGALREISLEAHPRSEVTMASAALYERKRYGPGSLLVRPAWWAHRVELNDEERGSWSLVIVFPKVQEWGFYKVQGWINWRSFHGAAGCTEDVAAYNR
jgi:hypothetical protein